MGHNYIGHNCMGHNYIGHNCMGHNLQVLAAVYHMIAEYAQRHSIAATEARAYFDVVQARV